MRLIGNFLSPYVRRVAVSLNILDLPFEGTSNNGAFFRRVDRRCGATVIFRS